MAYPLRERGVTTFETLGQPGVLVTGYSRLQPAEGNATPVGVAIFGFHSNGMLVSEAGVPGMTAMLAGRTYAEVKGPANTGMAIANPNDFPVTVSFSITSAFGTTIRQGSFTLEANHQIAAFLNESPFGATGSFEGALTFDASAPVGIIALRSLVNETGEFLMTTQTVAPLSPQAGPVVLGHFAEGGGWKTRVLLVNPTDSVISGSVQFYGEDPGTAGPIRINVSGQGAVSFPYTIPARASVKLETAGFGIETQVGSIRITPAGGVSAPSAFAEFLLTSGGVTVAQSSIQAAAPGTALRMFVESFGSPGQPTSLQSGVAITNTSAAAAAVTLELLDPSGLATGLTASLSVPGQGHVSKFLSEMFPTLPSEFRGVLSITSGGAPLSVVSLRTRYNENQRFLITTMPVYNEASASTASELIFPHIADGEGYTTQFVLFGANAGQSSNGTARFFSRTGQPLPLTYR